MVVGMTLREITTSTKMVRLDQQIDLSMTIKTIGKNINLTTNEVKINQNKSFNRSQWLSQYQCLHKSPNQSLSQYQSLHMSQNHSKNYSKNLSLNKNLKLHFETTRMIIKKIMIMIPCMRKMTILTKVTRTMSMMICTNSIWRRRKGQKTNPRNNKCTKNKRFSNSKSLNNSRYNTHK